MQRLTTGVLLVVLLLGVSNVASAALIFTFVGVGGSGLAGEAEFTLLDPTTLEVRLRNISVGVPDGFESSDQLLTGVSWDFGHPGFNGDAQIVSGTVVIGPTSSSVNFDTGSYGPGTDVGGEYGYGNMDGTGALTNFVSGNSAQATPFGGANLDGSVSTDGPQAGLVADPILVPLGGLGAIQDEIIATLTLSEALLDLDFLSLNGVRFEFGSDAGFFTVNEPSNGPPGTIVPEPSTLILCALLTSLAIPFARRRRRRTA